ncbi:hypothetical protein ScPMuIL_003451 [Solemya velum]
MLLASFGVILLVVLVTSCMTWDREVIANISLNIGVVNDSRVCGEQPMDNVLERQGRFDIPGYCVYVVVREVCADLHEPLNVIRSVKLLNKVDLVVIIYWGPHTHLLEPEKILRPTRTLYLTGPPSSVATKNKLTQLSGEEYADNIRVPIAVISHLGMKSVFLIYEDFTAGEAGEISQIINANGVTVASVNINKLGAMTDLHEMLLHSYEVADVSSQPLFIVFCRRTCVTVAVSEANHLSKKEMRRSEIGQFSKWIVLPLDEIDENELIPLVGELNNLLLVTNLGETGDNSYHLDSDRTGQDILNVIEEALTFNDGRLLGMDIKRSILETIENHLTRGMAGLRDRYELRTLLWTDSGRNFSSVGYFDGVQKVLVGCELFPNSIYGLNRRKVIVTTRPDLPFVMKTVENNKTWYSGLLMDVLEELATLNNFTYELVEAPDGEWGQEVNGKWTGLVGQLERREVDILIASIAMKTSREEVMDFVPVPFYYDYTSVLLKRPDPSDTKWRTLLDPFLKEIYICIACTFVIVTVLIYIIERNSESAPSKNTDGEENTIDHVFLYLLASLFTEGAPFRPRSVSSRTIVSFWWIFTIILGGIYSGKLISILTVPKYKLPFTNLEEMVAQTEYKWGLLGGTFRVPVLKSSNLPTYKKLWEGVVSFNESDPSVLALTTEEHVQKVLEGGYAFIADRTGMDIRKSTNCDLMTTDDKFFPMMYGIGLPNNSPYTKIMANQMAYIVESGVLQSWKRKWWPKENTCQASETNVRVITLLDVQSAFYIAGAMFVLALIILVLEISLGSNRWKKIYIEYTALPIALTDVQMASSSVTGMTDQDYIKYGRGVPNTVIGPKVFLGITSKVDLEKWKNIARHLNVSEEDIQDIQNGDSKLSERLYQVLLKWRQSVWDDGFGAYPDLVSALRKEGQHATVDKLKEIIDKELEGYTVTPEKTPDLR